ncbi:uncharacterized protein LOC110013264 [Sesamum indicum]|uniref:Uncharacterized protein LOC110013264 n=1 Tax=Sesamum indicum TaxID=4182 RepID=A0A8M8VFY8_SESIN|nr:uncharacterized protein LOC110013264 [Sesamum indicum]
MTEQLEREALYIHPSENSSLVLSSSPLDGKNFLPWNRSVYVALGTKMKLGFIDGTFSRPTIDSATFEQWRRVDLMVMSWIWNSISKDMVESFMYVSSSRELWLEIQAYVTKLKKIWNELMCLAPAPKCTCGGCSCGVNKGIAERNENTQLMQFLIGLYESFDNERSQILMQDPIPDLERAFSMIFTVEKQRAVQTDLGDSSRHMAY